MSMTITYYYLISKERLQKLKETNISLTIARNIVTTVGIANQTQHTIPVLVATVIK